MPSEKILFTFRFSDGTDKTVYCTSECRCLLCNPQPLPIFRANKLFRNKPFIHLAKCPKIGVLSLVEKHINMNLKKLTLASLTLIALAACGGKTESSVPAEGAAQAAASAPVQAAAAGLVEGQNYTVLAHPVEAQQAGKVEVLEFFGYFCPHCAHLEPVLSEHVKTFQPDTYLRKEHVVWDPNMKPLARLAAAIDMTNLHEQADIVIFKAMTEDKIQLNDPAVLKSWLAEQTAFDGKKVLAAFELPESGKRADKMENLTMAHQINSTPTVIVGGKYEVKFSDWDSGMKTIDLLVEKVREEQKEQVAAK